MADDVDPIPHPGLAGRVEGLLSRLQRPGIRVSELLMLWGLAFSVVVVAVVVFFVPLLWIFS